MNEFSIWMQRNWYALGNLLAEFSFLAAGVWFARKILKAVRSSQEQFGALLKLTLSDGLNERSKARETAQFVLADWPAAVEAPALSLPGPELRSKHLAAAWRGLIRWLQTPMGTGNGSHTSWQRILHWLQAPAGS